jgi:predicted nucleotidyltransferase
MQNLLQNLRQNREEIYTIAKKYGVSNIRIFGSVARGEENEKSDIDLLVSLSKHKGMGFDLIRFEREFSEKFSVKTDVISENGLHSSLKEKIFSEAVSL